MLAYKAPVCQRTSEAQWSLIPRGLSSISETKSSDDITRSKILGVFLPRCLVELTMC